MKLANAAFAVGLAAAAGGCSSQPSPEQLQETLVNHPQILYAVIQKHPAEFLDVLNKAVTAAQEQQQSQAGEAQLRRRDEELRHPKQPVVTAARAVRGNRAAPVTIVEYTDFQCPYCRQEEAVLRQVVGRYEGKVRLVIKQTPLVDIHPQALPAARMFEAIAMQSPEKAWQFHDLLFANQDRLQEGGPAFLEAAARSVGADVPRALADAQGPAVAAIIREDQAEAKRFGFSGTPGILINGVSFDGAYPEGELAKVIDRQLAAMGKA
ncbi:MAG: thiol:disulfide interchange protein [Gemmatimonadetes bacterium]|nr:thiol:disulfide interchange protein [Gemmatimonadota bacterium]